MSRQEQALTPDRVMTAMLRQSFAPAFGSGSLTALVVGLLHGAGAGWSALVGVVIALGFFGSGLVVMSRLVRRADPMLFVAVGMSVYLAQILVLLGVLVVARGIDGLDMPAAGIAMLVTVIVWQAAQLRAWRRARTPVYDPAPDEAEGQARRGPGGGPMSGSL